MITRTFVSIILSIKSAYSEAKLVALAASGMYSVRTISNLDPLFSYIWLRKSIASGKSELI